jgi:hypothetical protein
MWRALPLPVLLFAVALGAPSQAPQPAGQVASTKIYRWDRVRRGANLFNRVERPERLRAARAAGMTLVRLAPNKWLNGRPERELGDFLLGPRGRFTGIPPRDLDRLRTILDEAGAAGLDVVLTMLSLPGSRWAQHNGGIEERRIWTDPRAQEDAIRFWVELATALRAHPAVAAYNIRNEPSPERAAVPLADWHTGDYEAWYSRVRGTSADLNLFYARVVAAIRRADPDTPVVLDAGFYATPWAFKVLEPIADDRVIYSFHMYEPYAFTNAKNAGTYRYPGRIPVGETANPGDGTDWDRARLERFLQPVADWQRRHAIPSSRILAGEFGVVRTHVGAEEYLRDLIAIFEARRWHWAFYGYREDEWPAMDYELGTGRVPAAWWQAHGRGTIPDAAAVYRPNSLWQMLERAVQDR